MVKSALTAFALLASMAIAAAFTSSHVNGVWVNADAPDGSMRIRMIGNDWVESYKYDANGRVVRHNWIDSSFKNHSVCYDPETGDALFHEVM